jgi:hypothetical protein
MSVNDYVTLEIGYPEYGIPAGEMFRTKNLFAGGGDFTITVQGCLVENVFVEEPRTDGEQTREFPRIPRLLASRTTRLPTTATFC